LNCHDGSRLYETGFPECAECRQTARRRAERAGVLAGVTKRNVHSGPRVRVNSGGWPRRRGIRAFRSNPLGSRRRVVRNARFRPRLARGSPGAGAPVVPVAPVAPVALGEVALPARNRASQATRSREFRRLAQMGRNPGISEQPPRKSAARGPKCTLSPREIPGSQSASRPATARRAASAGTARPAARGRARS
jgi:hypothetical protein